MVCNTVIIRPSWPPFSYPHTLTRALGLSLNPVVQQTEISMTILKDDLEAPADQRRFGMGWVSGVAAFVLSVLAFGTVICLRYPDQFAAMGQPLYKFLPIRLTLQIGMIAAFLLASLSLALRRNKVLGTTSMAIILLASALGGPHAQTDFTGESDLYLGLDFFLLNLVFLGLVFVPIERIAGNRAQPIFRTDWREDLLYFLVGSLLVQGVTFLSITPSMTILKQTQGASFRDFVAAQPIVIQFFEIMFLTDVVQYLVHRLFHRIPWLWRFHAIHHSAPAMDWLASSRMHLIEVVCLRATTVMPMFLLGFAQPALYAYIVVVYFWSAMIHSNVRLNFRLIEHFIVTPRFHHWHHGIEREAIDVNFAIHFPILDQIFGTFYLPEKQWPSGYGVINPKIPRGYWQQFLFPLMYFRRTKPLDSIDDATHD